MQNELDSIKKEFFKYLNNLGISAKSHKNYRSDISHFSNWLVDKVKSFGSTAENLTDTIPFLSHDLAVEYKNEISKSASIKTANRRLSTLRHLSRFLTSTQVIDTDFMTGIENIIEFKPEKTSSEHPLVGKFGSYLEAEKISPNTIKNYLSDIRQFLVWLESNHQIQDSKF